MNVAEFARWAIENSAFDGCSLDGWAVQEKAVACGILEKVPYDPKKHGPSNCGVPEGGDWYVYTRGFKKSEKRTYSK